MANKPTKLTKTGNGETIISPVNVKPGTYGGIANHPVPDRKPNQYTMRGGIVRPASYITGQSLERVGTDSGRCPKKPPRERPKRKPTTISESYKRYTGIGVESGSKRRIGEAAYWLAAYEDTRRNKGDRIARKAATILTDIATAEKKEHQQRLMDGR